MILSIHRNDGSGRYDFLGIFAQPVDEENFIAHKMLAWIREDWMDPRQLKSDQQRLSAQDKCVLEQHNPIRLPLNHLGEGLLRQYSLWNGPKDRNAYLVGVKLERESRGGSAAMHKLKEGDRLEISFPRNNFALNDSPGPAILLAGGIGITPVLAMARHRAAKNLPVTLHLFARDVENIPFNEQLTVLPDAPIHLGLMPPTIAKMLAGILSDPAQDAHVYMCGPGPFMDLVEKQTASAGWPSGRMHLGRFSVAPETLDVSGDTFEAILKQSSQCLTIALIKP